MLKKQSVMVLSMVLMVLLILSCAPKQQDTRATAQTQPTPVATTAAAKPATVSAEEAAWAQVVSAAKKEGKLTLYTWGITGQPGVKVSKAFKEAYGIEVETITGVIPTLIERLKTEAAAGKYLADTFDASTSSVQIVKTAGLLQPLGYLPALSQKSAFRNDPVIDQEGSILSVGLNYRAILINTNLTKAGQEPKSYKELLEPKWSGKIVIPSPVTAVGMNQLYAMKDQLGLNEDYFRQLAKAGVITVATDKDAADMVIRGEAHVLPSSSLLQSSADVVKGAPVKAVFPTEGTMAGFGNTWSMVKNGPHPNAARLFVNWLLSPEGQKVYGEASAWTPIRKDVPDFIPAPLAVPQGTKILLSDLPNEMKIAELRTQRVVAKMMGIEK